MGRYAIKTPTHHTTWDKMLEVWTAADATEVFESAWNFDHFYPLRGDTNGPCLEAWVTLSALAQATNRIRVGTMVCGMHFRHPAVTASMASSLDIVSKGRLELGLGAGWYPLEADAYGMDLGTVDERMTRFEEGTEVIHQPPDRGDNRLRGQVLLVARCSKRAEAGSEAEATNRDRWPW